MSTPTLTDSPETAAPASIAADLSHCAERTRTVVESLGLTRSHLLRLIGRATPERLAALDTLLGLGRRTRRTAIREVLVKLEDRLDVDLGSDQLRGGAARVGAHLASVFGAILGIGCGYIVIGGLLEGDSLMLGDSAGPMGLVIFLGVLALLATFEALHVSAAILKIADLGALSEKYPRAAELHRRFHTDDGLARFLAGRQLIVVGTVFLCSSLSSFPDLTYLPFTDIPLPSMLLPLIVIGMPGALFVLWYGQLAPQFIATRHAVQLTNTRLAGFAFRLAYGLEAAGLARVGFWVAAWDTTTEKIPFSAALRWRQSAEEVDGVGIVGLVRDWTVDAAGVELRATSTQRVYETGLTAVTDGSMLIPGAPAQLRLEAEGAGASGRPVQLAPTEHREELLPTGARRFHKPLVSAIGSFDEGDTLLIRLAAKYTSGVGQDVVHVEHPVRFVAFLVTPTAMPREMAPATLRTFNVGTGLGDLTEIAAEPVEPVEGPDGVPVLNHVIDFPPPNTLYVLDWEVVL
jgi:hypothetical protein